MKWAFLIAAVGCVLEHGNHGFGAFRETMFKMTSRVHEQQHVDNINPVSNLIGYFVESWICGKQIISAEPFSSLAERMRDKAAIVDAESHDYLLPFRLPVVMEFNKDGDLERLYLHKDRVTNRLRHSSDMRRLDGTWTCTSLRIRMLGAVPVPLCEPMSKICFAQDICVTDGPIVLQFLTVFSAATDGSVHVSLRYPDPDGDRVLRARLGQPLDFRLRFISGGMCFVQSRDGQLGRPGEIGWLLVKDK